MDDVSMKGVQLEQMFGKIVRKRPKLESDIDNVVKISKPNIIRHTRGVNPPRQPKKEKESAENKIPHTCLYTCEWIWLICRQNTPL